MIIEFTLPNKKKQLSVRDKMNIWLKENPWPHNKFIGTNIIGRNPQFKQEELLARNRALAEPRNDPRFKGISTSHPSKSSKFTGERLTNKKK